MQENDLNAAVVARRAHRLADFLQVGHSGRDDHRFPLPRDIGDKRKVNDFKRSDLVGRCPELLQEIGGRVVDPQAAVSTPCDVLAPCGPAKVIGRSTVNSLQCRIVAGGANDVLATHDVATMLAHRGIVYVPDFVINAGGVIQIHALRSEWGPDKLEGSMFAIGDRVARIVNEADRSRRTPVAVAEEMASHRLGRPISLPN